VIDYLNPVADVSAGGYLGSRAVLANPKIGMEIIRVVHLKFRRGVCHAISVNDLYRPFSDLRKLTGSQRNIIRII